MRESFIFYKSFLDAAQTLTDKDKKKLIDAIIQYGIYNTMPNLKGAPAGMFALIKPVMDANTKRYENGKKGGRPKTETKPKQNQNETKTKPKQNQNETKAKPNNNVNVNENVNVNKNKEGEENTRAYGRFENVYLSDFEKDALAIETNKSDEYIERLSEHKKSTGSEYVNDYATLIKWMRKDGIIKE